MRYSRFITLLAVAFTAAGCGRTPQLDVRSFEVAYMNPEQAVELITPYVFSDRDGAAGTYSVAGNIVTVRETTDNLNRIEALLRQYDLRKPLVTLHIDVIEADGGGVDPAIAGIAGQLRELFNFSGYQRAAGGLASAAEGSRLVQSMGVTGANRSYQVTIHCGRFIQAEGIWIIPASLGFSSGRGLVDTEVRLREGQTTLIGTSTTGDIKAVILAIRPEIVR